MQVNWPSEPLERWWTKTMTHGEAIDENDRWPFIYFFLRKMKNKMCGYFSVGWPLSYGQKQTLVPLASSCLWAIYGSPKQQEESNHVPDFWVWEHSHKIGYDFVGFQYSIVCLRTTAPATINSTVWLLTKLYTSNEFADNYSSDAFTWAWMNNISNGETTN